MVLVKHKYSLNFAFWVVQVFWNLFALNVSMPVIITCYFHSLHFKCIIYFNNLAAVFMLWLCSELCWWDINKHFYLCFFFMVPSRRNTYTLFLLFPSVLLLHREHVGFRISRVISRLYQETKFGKTKLQVLCNLLFGCLTLGHCSKTKWKPRKFYPVLPHNPTYEILI